MENLACTGGLRVTVVAVPADHELAKASLLDLPPAVEEPAIWLGWNLKMVGWGSAFLGEYQGKHAMREAAKCWRALQNSTEVLAPQLPFAAPLAWGSFGFAGSTPGYLRVPRIAVVEAVQQEQRYLVVSQPAAEGFFAPESAASLMDSIALEARVPEEVNARSLHLARGKMTQEQYRSAVAELISALRNGAASKVVMARDILIESRESLDARYLASRLHQLYPTTWVFAVQGLVGASPEMLASVHEGQLLSRVLAGTAAPGAGEELMASLKDRTEHMFAVESVARALAPLAEQLDVPAQPFILELPNVVHLASDVRAQLGATSNLLDVIDALHPTAAVCGTPTSTAFDLIERFERTERGRYSGPVGWIDAQGQGEFAIALRCGQLADDRKSIRIFAGGGIMPDSDADAELRETQAKMRPVMQALGVADA